MKLKTKLIISLFIMVLLPGFALILLMITAAARINSVILRREFLIQAVTLVVIIIIITAIALYIWLFRGVLRPIQDLTAATREITEGNLDFYVESDSDDEIGELSRSFEEMRSRLKESSEEKLIAEQDNRDLIRNISHDLKTPITAIKGYAEGLLDGVAGTPDKVEKYVRTIYNKADEMTVLINELTLYSQIDSNRIPYNFVKLNISEYFKEAAEDLTTELEGRELDFSLTDHVGPGIPVIADPEQLSRVISNVISNSIKYNDKSKGYIHINLSDVGDFVQVEIEDNGSGISREELPHIFDRFYRTDASRNSRTGGSGIGLSIARKIIEDHGGRIWATSLEGSGTTVYFVLRKA